MMRFPHHKTDGMRVPTILYHLSNTCLEQYLLLTGTLKIDGGGHGEEHMLRSCYRRSLELAADHGCETVAFPLISSGVYGYPKADAFRVATEAVSAFLQDHDLTVYLVLFDRAAFLLGGDRFGDVQSFIDDAYAQAEEQRPRNQASYRWEREPRAMLDEDACCFEAAIAPKPAAAPRKKPKPLVKAEKAVDPDLESMLRQLDEGFSRTLLKLIDERGMTDVQCYKRANIDRKLFSKIRSDPAYKPSKTTAIALALALELPLPETQSLLSRAGYTLSHSFLFDIIVEACIRKGVFNVLTVNELLFAYDQPLLGS